MKFQYLAPLYAAIALTIACSQTDAGLTASVKTRLGTDESVKARNINVDTRDHVVTLTGQVQTAEEQVTALEIARRTDGVVDVVDHLTVASRELQAAPTSGRVGEGGPATAGRVVLDPGITADVKSRLLADSTVKNLNIDVNTKDRVVTLSGTVETQTQKDQALEVARSVDNVARVENKLIVRKPSR
jgi:hyperosmotically inducible periplasmic protein